jgi:hypothetical protein
MSAASVRTSGRRDSLPVFPKEAGNKGDSGGEHSFFGEPGKQHSDGGHVLFDCGWRSLALSGFDVGGHRNGLNVFKVLVTGKRSDLFHGIVRRHGMLRKFSPALLDALELTQDTEGEQSACLRALQMLKELNATGRCKLPEDAPTDFLPKRLKPIVINHGEIDRRAWECALLPPAPMR